MSKPKVDPKYFMSQGFNKTQAMSLAWAEYFEDKAAEIEYRYQGNVDSTIRVSCFCHTCNVGGEYLPDTVRSFIISHKDHATKTMRFK